MAFNSLSKANQKDHISNLPDEILVLVLSRLSMKEAARTCVLSPRWKNIWKFYTGVFNFDAIKMIMDVLRRKILGCIGAHKYVFWVNQVLNSNQSQVIEELRICFDLQIDFTNDIDRWIDFAIAKRVQRLELDLSPTSNNNCPCYYPHRSPDDRHVYKFPTWLLDFPLGCPDFDALTSLRLKSVHLTDEVVLHFLSNLQMLEHLSIDYSPSLHNLKVVGPSVKLKHLEVTNCFQLKNLDVSASNLMFFKYAGPKINMFFGDVPKLSSVSLGGYYCNLVTASRAKEFPFSLSQLEMLALVQPMLMFGSPKSLPELTHLIELEFKFTRYDQPSVRCLSMFMHASPRLQKLVLKCESDRNERIKPEFMSYQYVPAGLPGKGGFEHQNLKEVEFFGWNDPKVFFELIEHVIKIASSLERITVDPFYRYDLLVVTLPATDEEIQVARKLARQLEPVLQVLSPTTNLVIL